MDNPQKPDTTSHKFNPALLLFLLFPLMGIVAALATGRSATSNAAPVPPPVAFTPTTLIGSAAPDFALSGLDGKAVQLSSFRGQWVYLNFWATWCAPCRQELPVYQELLSGEFGDYRGKLAFLAVDQNETADTVNAYLKKYNFHLPIVLDPDAKATNLYGILNLPITFIIDPQGVLRYEHIGAMTPDYLQRYLQDEFGSVGYVF